MKVVVCKKFTFRLLYCGVVVFKTEDRAVAEVKKF